ncbi:MAG: hypothetical protein ACYC9Q_12410 [Bacillota bacterium]
MDGGGKPRDVIAAGEVNNERAVAFWRRHGYEKVGGAKAAPDGTTVYELRKRLSR